MFSDNDCKETDHGPADPDVANLLNDLGDVAGQGTSGCVHVLKSDPEAVVKEIRTDGMDAHLIEAIETELKFVPCFCHQGILQYQQILRYDDFIYIRMKRYEGSLESIITKCRRQNISIDNSFFHRFISQIASALAYLHSPNKEPTRGMTLPILIHRDIKPTNIMVSDNGSRFVIADFGLCREGLGSSSRSIGTPAYAAPEVVLQKKHIPASDVWSFGVVIYELATLKKPNFLGKRKAEDVFIEGWTPDLSQLKNKAIQELLRRIFVLNPEDRISAQEIADLFESTDTLSDVLIVLATEALERRCQALEEANYRYQSELENLKDLYRQQTNGCTQTLSQSLCPQNAEPISLVPSENLRIPDPPSPTALMIAASAGDVSTVKTLIEEGVLLRKRDAAGMTALMHAARNDHREVAELLSVHEWGIQDTRGMTAMMHAVEARSVAIAGLLAVYEADVMNAEGRTGMDIVLDTNDSGLINTVLTAIDPDA